jgi:TFIIF, beta subunit HTH domain/TFIIF, beta subunit N-terminus
MDDDDEEEERVTANSYGAIYTSAVDDECWMIRVPQKLAELIDKAAEGTELGEMVFTKGGTLNGKIIKPSLAVHIAETLTETVAEQQQNHLHQSRSANSKPPAKIPLNYSMQAMTKKIPVMHPFVRNPKNGSCTIFGTVTRTANLQVEQGDSNYRAMLKDRLVTSNLTSNRFVKPAEVSESVVTKRMDSSTVQGGSSGSSNKRSFGNAVFRYGKKLLESQEAVAAAAATAGHHLGGGGPAQKRARQFAPDQPLRSVLFELFGQEPYWTIKDLKAAAVHGGCTLASGKRAEAEIRDILRNEIGEYHRSGDHKNKWELRKEFQQQRKGGGNDDDDADDK